MESTVLETWPTLELQDYIETYVRHCQHCKHVLHVSYHEVLGRQASVQRRQQASSFSRVLISPFQTSSNIAYMSAPEPGPDEPGAWTQGSFYFLGGRGWPGQGCLLSCLEAWRRGGGSATLYTTNFTLHTITVHIINYSDFTFYQMYCHAL